MESSIAVFLMRQLACEQLPTVCVCVWQCFWLRARNFMSPAVIPMCMRTAICPYRWLGKQAGLTALPRGWAVGQHLVIPSRPFGYGQV